MCLNQARGPGIAPPGSPPPRVNTHQNTISNRSDGALAPTPQQTSTIDANFNRFLEAEPAKNPSFWTRKTEIEEVYTKIGDFWLPSHNHSVTAIRLGGYADLTIDYKDYEITGASEVSSLSSARSALHAESGNAPRLMPTQT